MAEGGALTKSEAAEMRSKLEKQDADSGILKDILQQLLNREISQSVVIDTKIGMAVKALRKHEKVGKLAAELTAKWKTLFAPSQSSSSSSSKQSTPAADSKNGGKGSPPVDSRQATTKAPPPKKIDPSEPGADKRSKVRDLLEKAIFNKETCPSLQKARDIAQEIEEALYSHFKGPTEQYTSMVKSIKFNLTDPKNPDFRSRVASGEIVPGRIPTLTSSQMAGKEKIAQIEDAIKGKAFQMELFKIQQVQETTDMFECGKCRQRKTTFYQKQTRSADEPMTIFITCQACGNEWRE